MSIISKMPTALLASAMLVMPMSGSLSAQELGPDQTDSQINVYGSAPADLSDLPQGPDIEGIISARDGSMIQVTGMDGVHSDIELTEDTRIRGSGGFLGLNRTELASQDLLNGLPVTVETVNWNGVLVASNIKYKTSDFETAAMIRGGTAQQFALHGAAIDSNAAATEALRGRMGDIDQYNIKGVTNVYFDTGKATLSAAAQSNLCAMAAQAEATDNALLLVVGYTDSTGSQDYNQVLSDRRAGRVVNYLQQACGWAPYRMLTPTGMAEADPLADNSTASGKAQNRRVAVNVLVSKAVDGQGLALR